MSKTSTKQRYTQLKEWLKTVKTSKVPTTRSPQRKTYDRK